MSENTTTGMTKATNMAGWAPGENVVCEALVLQAWAPCETAGYGGDCSLRAEVVQRDPWDW